ncbi:MAG: potassium channel family protein [Planctomycetaceae bacterium]|nr:two pore domain potassium channel family protein [Planctomycetaceae bacterium]
MFVVLLITCLLVLLAVSVHYFALVMLTWMLDKTIMRRWIAVSVLGALLAHVVEVSLFALGYAFFHMHESYGRLEGELRYLAEDFWYFSFVAYTSLGFGDITPRGALRFFTAVETLTGLVLIAWTASFIFMHMEKDWRKRDGNP